MKDVHAPIDRDVSIQRGEETTLERNKRRILLAILIIGVVVGSAIYYIRSEEIRRLEAEDPCAGYPLGHPLHPGFVAPPEIGIPAEGYQAVTHSSEFRETVLGDSWSFLGWSCDFWNNPKNTVTGIVYYNFQVGARNATVEWLSTIYYLPTGIVTVLPPQSGVVGTSSSSCLVELPDNSTISYFADPNSVGYFATYPNGKKLFFPLGSCPQPAQPELYGLALAVENNPKFVAAENNALYLLDSGVGLGMKEWGNFNGTSRSFTVLIFNHYSNRVIFPCEGNFMALYDLGQLQVLIPLNSTGGYDLENMIIQSIPTEQLNAWFCPAMVSTTTGVNSTTVMALIGD